MRLWAAYFQSLLGMEGQIQLQIHICYCPTKIKSAYIFKIDGALNKAINHVPLAILLGNIGQKGNHFKTLIFFLSDLKSYLISSLMHILFLMVMSGFFFFFLK